MVKNFIAQKLGVYAVELGMGIEPIYNSSAGCRLSHSATPARTHRETCRQPHKNIVDPKTAAAAKLLYPHTRSNQPCST